MARASKRSVARRAVRLAILLAASVPATSCILKKPPEAAELKATAMPSVTVPPQWTAAGAGTGAVSSNWLTEFKDEQLTALVVEAIAHNPNLQIGAARMSRPQ